MMRHYNCIEKPAERNILNGFFPYLVRNIVCHSRNDSLRVLIVAINHQIQPAQIMSASTNGSLEAFEKGQKENFAEFLRGHIRTHGVQFVGEETRYGAESIAQRVCGQEGCRHANIDMTP